MKPGITLAMIVRDDAAKLRRCLDSVRSAVEAMVVVDTGSTDDSVAVARSFGAEVRQIEWPADFAAARNVSLEGVATEWVLWLDSDEWLAEGAAAKVRAAVEFEGAYGFMLTRQDLFPNGGHSEQELLRLWRNDPDIRFEGIIHEHLNFDTIAERRPGQLIFTADIRFWHDGYLPELTPAKAARNLPLLERELARDPESFYIALERAGTLKALDRPEWREAESEIDARVLAMRDSDEPPNNTATLYFMRRFAELSDEANRSAETDALLRMARGWFSDHPGVLYMCAQVEIRRKDLRRAFQDLLKVERMAISGDYDRLTTTVPSMLGTGLSTNLALVAHQLGRKDIAARHYRRLLELDPTNAVARENLALL